MNSKQRVLKAINHEEPDRVPLDYSAKPEVSQALCEYLGLTWDGPYEHWQIHPEALMQRFHIDLRFRSARYIGDEEKTLPDGCMINRWGVVFKNGYPLIAPLAHAKTVADVEAHPWPDPSAFDYEHYAEMLEPFEEYAICGGEWSPFFTYGFEMVGMEKFLMGMVLEPELIHTVLDKICDYYLTVNEWMFQAARGKLDIFFTGDDFGSQQGLLLSPDMFRTFIAPRLKRFYDLAHSYGLKVMHHSCGAIRDIIPDLINLGVDILDPIQVRAAGMDPVRLKRDFGRQIAFHGAIDTQDLLPNSDVAGVRAEVRRLLNILGKNGGYILAGSQDYLEDIPLENIIAIYDTAYEYGWY